MLQTRICDRRSNKQLIEQHQPRLASCSLLVIVEDQSAPLLMPQSEVGEEPKFPVIPDDWAGAPLPTLVPRVR